MTSAVLKLEPKYPCHRFEMVAKVIKGEFSPRNLVLNLAATCRSSSVKKLAGVINNYIAKPSTLSDSYIKSPTVDYRL